MPSQGNLDNNIATCRGFAIVCLALCLGLLGGCSTHYKMGEAAINYVEKLQTSDLHYLPNYDKILFTTYNENSFGHSDSADRSTEETVCRFFNESELLADLASEELISKPAKCFTADNKPDGKVLEIRIEQSIKFTKKTAKLIYRDHASGEIFSEDEMVMIPLHNIWHFVYGDYATRMIVATKPAEGTEEHVAWKQKIMSMCNKHDSLVECG